MKTFTVTYTVKFELSIAPNYVWTTNDLCFNLRTGRQLKQIYKSGTIGYSIKGKFMSLKKLRPLLINPKQNKLQF